MDYDMRVFFCPSKTIGLWGFTEKFKCFTRQLESVRLKF